jgi:hypothetical protein
MPPQQVLKTELFTRLGGNLHKKQMYIYGSEEAHI